MVQQRKHSKIFKTVQKKFYKLIDRYNVCANFMLTSQSLLQNISENSGNFFQNKIQKDFKKLLHLDKETLKIDKSLSNMNGVNIEIPTIDRSSYQSYTKIFYSFLHYQTTKYPQNSRSWTLLDALTISYYIGLHTTYTT